MPSATCSKCGEVFAHRPGDRAACPECGAVVPRPAKKPAADPPARRRKQSARRSPTGTPVAVWVGGGVAAVAVLAVGVYLAVGSGRAPRPTDPVETAEVKPVKPAPPPTRPIPPPTKPSVPPQPTPDPDHRPAPNPPPPEDAAGEPPIDRDWPALPPRKQPRETALTPNRTTVRVYPARAGGPPLVVLDLPTEPYMKPGPFRGLLLRELVRQAVLVAAREELGAQTRDAVLRETTGDLTATAPTCTLELGWVAPRGKPVEITLAAGTGEAARVVWRADVPVPAGEVFDYDRVAAALEPLTRGPLADALAKEAKLARVAAKPGRAAVPAATTDRLRAMNWYDQFAAVRELHQAYTATADPAVAGHLATGYANLGVLTERNWSVAHKAYKARALLYAHRAAAADAAAGKWPLAYATALLGLHARSLELLADAKAAGAGPAWAPLVEAACRFDHAKLAAPPPRGYAELAGLLAFVSAECRDTKAHSLGIGFAQLQTNPDCFRVVAGVLTLAELKGLRLVTEWIPTQMPATLARMAKLPGAPAAAADRLRAGGETAERDFLRAFAAAGVPATDRGEPSWGALAAAVRDVRFIVLDSRVHVYERFLGLPPDAEVQAAAAFIEDHPDRGHFAHFPKSKTDENRAAVESYQMNIDRPGLHFDDPKWVRVHETPMFGRDAGYATAAEHVDDSATDLRLLGVLPPEPDRPGFAKRERAVSPHAPTGFARLIESDAAAAADPALETTWAGRPPVLIALAKRRQAENKPADAERLYRAAVKVSPDIRTYMALTEVLKADEAKWVAVLDEFLTKPDYGLDHARVCQNLAYHFMQKNLPRKAWPYAERSAQSGSSWGLMVAEACARQLGDAKRAAAYAEERQRRYGDGVPTRPE